MEWKRFLRKLKKNDYLWNEIWLRDVGCMRYDGRRKVEQQVY